MPVIPSGQWAIHSDPEILWKLECNHELDEILALWHHQKSTSVLVSQNPAIWTSSRLAREHPTPKQPETQAYPLWNILTGFFSIANSAWISPNYLAQFNPNPWRTDRDLGNSLKAFQTGNFSSAPSVLPIAVINKSRGCDLVESTRCQSAVAWRHALSHANLGFHLHSRVFSTIFVHRWLTWPRLDEHLTRGHDNQYCSMTISRR
jgi:hypothetical protein